MKISVKTPKEIKIMSEGGKRLHEVKEKLREEVHEGVSAWRIEETADRLIKKTGGSPSFKMVPKYFWATCININEGVVHGIPTTEMVFKKGDIVSVDVGLYYKGFHTDTSFSVGIGLDNEEKVFLKAGEEAFSNALVATKQGNRVYDVSNAIESTLDNYKFTPVRALVGHGVGRELHEEPPIPGFVSGSYNDSPEIPVGAVFAIEVIYAKGSPNIVISNDGWTISTADGKISALFEDSVAVTKKGPILLT